MTARPKPPADYDENPPLDADFFNQTRPATIDVNARLREALKEVIRAHETGASLDAAIADARAALTAAQ